MIKIISIVKEILGFIDKDETNENDKLTLPTDTIRSVIKTDERHPASRYELGNRDERR